MRTAVVAVIAGGALALLAPGFFEYELSPDGTRVMTIRGTAETLDPIWISNTDGSDRAAMPIRTSDLLSWQRMPAP